MSNINEENKIMYECAKCNNEIELPELFGDSWSCNNPINLEEWVKYFNSYDNTESKDPITLAALKEWDKSELIKYQPRSYEKDYITWNRKLFCHGSLKPKDPMAKMVLDIQSIENNECPECGSYIDIDQKKCIECGHVNPYFDLGVI